MTADLPDISTLHDPCQECRLQEQCIDHRLACEAFTASRRGEDWAELPRKPTRALYLLSLPEDERELYVTPEPDPMSEKRKPGLRKPRAEPIAVVRKRKARKRAEKANGPSRRERIDARAHEWIGRTVNGREVVGFTRRECTDGRKYADLLLRLRCVECGTETTRELSRVNRSLSCECQRGALIRARTDARAREWIGRAIGGREVIACERGNAAWMALRLRCGCGREALYPLSEAERGRVKACRCGGRGAIACAP